MSKMPIFAELQCKTSYSFLNGASQPEELVARAAELGISTLAITDLNGVYGLPKAYKASLTQAKFKIITGAELVLEGKPNLSLLATNRKGYGLLCRIITKAHQGIEKGHALLKWEDFLNFMELEESTGLIAIPRLELPWEDSVSHDYGSLKDIFRDRIYIPLTRTLDGWDRKRTEQVKFLSNKYGFKIIATSDVHFHIRERKRLHDILISIQNRTTLSEVGKRIFPNEEKFLKSPMQMAALFSDLPEALSHTLEVSDRCSFSMRELRYRYPSEWLPIGMTAQSYLEELVWKGATWRYSGTVPEDVTKQLKHELKLIDELIFADYFLTIWEIVEFARERKILCQGRGSAANSAVCYCLGITAIDPVRMNLLFERFMSVERGEPPDIDVDFEHERREEVIQHVYQKYGRDRAGMVAAVITYRTRSAKKDLIKVLGTDKEEVIEPLVEEIYGFPRHLSIHTGGFTLSADPLIETVPIEPARMEGRTIVQWDKVDLEAIGLLKVDILALGMLSALRRCFEYVPALSLPTVPSEDPKTYEMIRRADTIGVFQIESRAQMSMLPRLLPKNFYDLVIELAIIRPGPIAGKMIHPFLKRRRGIEPVIYPDKKLIPILGKTLGVPIFQEQIMKMAVVLAGFSPGEADELRRAIGAKRATGSIEKMGKKLMEGLRKNGLPEQYAEHIYEQIQGFASYGFPESHSASFALLAYASSYLKCHYPCEFACALINSQPMGFYAIHTLLDDAKRHGVQVLPIDPNVSDWDCTIEKGQLRLGWRVVHGMGREEAQSAILARKLNKFTSLSDFIKRTNIRRNVLYRLAMGDVFAGFNVKQRDALWQILAYDLMNFEDKRAPQLSLFENVKSLKFKSHLQGLSEYEELCEDYNSFGLSVRTHPMTIVRKHVRELPKFKATEVKKLASGKYVSVAGLCIVRQRPATASNITFATLEDESGFIDLVLKEDVFEKYREVFLENVFLVAKGSLQRDGNSVSVLVKDLKSFGEEIPNLSSHDFH